MNETELRVLAGFFPATNDITIKELEQRSDYSYERVYSSLKNLKRYAAVRSKKVGKTLTFSLATESDLALLGFFYHSIKRRSEFAKSNRTVWKLLKEFSADGGIRCVILFGSYAKGDALDTSDVDVLCVADADTEIEAIARSLSHKYGIRLNPVKVRSIKDIEMDNRAFYEDVVEYGYVIKGLEYFYEQVYR
ncbi:MAG: nucleotidyltransferase domain-containing protein [Euryarchaeota archaeon]|nr:nucleotidyltransferase domain-containing protein [Euryarchaeota archaeon]